MELAHAAALLQDRDRLARMVFACRRAAASFGRECMRGVDVGRSEVSATNAVVASEPRLGFRRTDAAC